MKAEEKNLENGLFSAFSKTRNINLIRSTVKNARNILSNEKFRTLSTAERLTFYSVHNVSSYFDRNRTSLLHSVVVRKMSGRISEHFSFLQISGSLQKLRKTKQHSCRKWWMLTWCTPWCVANPTTFQLDIRHFSVEYKQFAVRGRIRLRLSTEIGLYLSSHQIEWCNFFRFIASNTYQSKV